MSDRLQTLTRQALELIDRFPDSGPSYAELREGMVRLTETTTADPEAALVRLRKTLEFVVHSAYERQFHEPPGTRPLENLLQRLSREGCLPRRLTAFANLVRDLGNVGAHLFGEGISRDDVAKALEQLLPILQWHAGASERGAGSTGEADGDVFRKDAAGPPDPVSRWRRLPVLLGGLGTLVALAGMAAGLFLLEKPGGTALATSSASANPLLPDWAKSLPAAPALRRVYGNVPPGAAEGRIALLQELRYRLKATAEWETFEDGAALSSTHSYRLSVTPNRQGYLYVFQVDSVGKLTVLFPTLSGCAYAEGTNPVAAEREVLIPAASVLYLDEQLGVEHIYTAFTLEWWPELEADLASCESKTPSSDGRQAVRQPLLLALRGVGGKASLNESRVQGTPLVARRGREFAAEWARGLVVERWFHHVATGP